MLPVKTSMGGLGNQLPPNVCKVPPYAVPAPFPSLAPDPATIPATQSMTTLVMGCPTSVQGSTGMTLPVDIAGTMLGNTGTVTGTFTVEMGSTRVFATGRPIAILSSLMSFNTKNTVGVEAVLSQPKVLASP